MARIWERWYPIVLGIAAAVLAMVVHWLFPQAHPGKAFLELLSATIGICSIAIGFLATAKSILIAIDDRDIIKRLKKLGRYRGIIRSLRFTIVLSFILAVASAAGLLVDLSDTATWTIWHALGFSVWIGLSTATALSCYHVINLFYLILDSGDDS